MSRINKQPFCREIEVQQSYLEDDVNGDGTKEKISIIFKKNSGPFCSTDGKTTGGYVKVEYQDETFERSDNFWDPTAGYSSGTFEYHADEKVVTFKAHGIVNSLWSYHIAQGKPIPKKQVLPEQETWKKSYEKSKIK